MPGRIYRAGFTVSLAGSGSEVNVLCITAPSTNNPRLTDVIISGDYDAATDDPVNARLFRVTGTPSGTSLTPAKHNTETSLASQCSLVGGDSITGLSEVTNSAVFDQFVKPGYSFKPGVVMAPDEKWCIALNDGAQAREIKVTFHWEE